MGLNMGPNRKSNMIFEISATQETPIFWFILFNFQANLILHILGPKIGFSDEYRSRIKKSLPQSESTT